MKKYLLFLFTAVLSTCAAAQDFPYGQVTADELNMKRYDKDTSAHAVVLQEYGTAKIAFTNDETISLLYEYHVKIKIFDSRAFDKGSVEIHLTGNDNVMEEATDINGTTTYINDDGLIKKFDLDPEKIYKLHENKYRTNVKFALPGLKKGCIVEYKFKTTSPFFYNFHPWFFQSNIPKIYSEYEAHIPAFWNYNIVLKGGLELTKKIAEPEKNCFSVHNAVSDCAHFVYGIKDVPAFVVEEYMTAPKNFWSAIYFELSDYTNPYTGQKKKITKEWADVDNDLKHAEYFGVQLKHTNLLKPRIAPLIADKTNDLDKAKAIYDYVKKAVKWNNGDNRASYEGIDKALEKHTGAAGDINLTLVTALNAAGINTEAVLLSTRNNGLVNKLYPTVDDFDYVIAKANIAGKSYFLDATDPLLGFGMLPLRCLNGEGRAMSLDKPSYWVDLNTGQKRGSTYSLDLTLQPDGKIKGKLVQYSTGYEAYEKRREIKRFNSVDEYVDSRDAKMNKIKILKSEITNLDSLDAPLFETYELEFAGTRNMNAARIGFNPFIFGRISTNPFKLAERNYPVDMGMPSDRRFVLTMHLPDGYAVDTPPTPVALAIPNQGGRFITNFEQGDHLFVFSDVTQFNKSVYSQEEYPSLKELYNKIIQSEKGELYFKKN
jgi:hypothetical protein